MTNAVDAFAGRAYASFRERVSQLTRRIFIMPVPFNPLPFPSDALEPNIDKQTMEIHHGKHYKAYVDNYNKAVSEKQPDLDGKPLHEVLAGNLAIVKNEIKTPVRNNGGGAHNHALFWEILNPEGKPGTQPIGKLADAIKSTFGCRSEEHTSELQSQSNLVCRLLLEKK